MPRKDLDVSKFHLERSEMSLAEMRDIVHEAADYGAPNGGWKERVRAAAHALNLGWERSKAFYYSTARRVDAEEMDNARAAIRAVREAARRRRDNDHLLWLESEIARHRASGEELRGPHVDGLEHFLRVARGSAGAVALQPDAPGDDPDELDC